MNLVYLIGLLASASVLAEIPPPPSFAAKSYLLTDFHTGKELAGYAPDQRLAPASLTKIMAVYVVLHELAQGKLKLDDLVTISEKAWRAEGSRTFVEVNNRVPVEVLLKGVIVQSGNDATIALAEHVAGDERTFAELMNQHARRLGMTNTHFTNSTGLPDPDHYTSARDLNILTQALIRDFPQYYPWFKLKEFSYNNIIQHNRNLLLWRDPSVDGVKTGHTEEAGYCLVASAEREGMRLIATVMGTPSEKARAEAVQALLGYGFRFFITQKLRDAGKLTEARVYKGEENHLDLGVTSAIYATVPRGEEKTLSTVLEAPSKIIAPVQKGQVLGRLKVQLSEQTVAEYPLVALQEVKEAGFLGRWIDEGLLKFQQWWRHE
ncbi:MAG: D-alanyl-D-alanine carboxypeptidase [Methylohalobius sp.]|nr:D-alanyl-D-alanine carboxypeptidase [Methylohalobius sp.]